MLNMLIFLLVNVGIDMNKLQLINRIASKSGLSRKDANAALTAAMEAIVEAVASDDKVMLLGFGTFYKSDRQPRLVRNPKTKQIMTIPARKVPGFSAGEIFKEAVK